jgi:hypothetical protein
MHFFNIRLQMRIKLIALAFVFLIALTVVAYYSLNSLSNFQEPLASPSPTPIPTQPSIPSIPSGLNTSAIGWGDPHSSYPTQLTIISPQNLTYPTSNLTLKVNVTTASWAINSVHYKADWLSDYHRIYRINDVPYGWLSMAITLTLNFTGIPEGSHTLEVIANYHDGSHACDSINFSTNSSLGH